MASTLPPVWRGDIVSQRMSYPLLSGCCGSIGGVLREHEGRPDPGSDLDCGAEDNEINGFSRAMTVDGVTRRDLILYDNVAGGCVRCEKSCCKCLRSYEDLIACVRPSRETG